MSIRELQSKAVANSLGLATLSDITVSGVSSLNGKTGTVTLTPGNNIGIGSSGNNISIGVVAVVTALQGLTGPVTLSSPDASISIGASGNDITLQAVLIPSFVDANQIYVSPNGNDTTGTGSQQNPYLTIGQAIIKRATILNTTEVTIILSSGTYTESFTLTRNTFLIGVQSGEVRQPCNIFGTITMSDVLGGNTGLTGLEINGSVTMTGVAGLFFTIFSCNISGGASTAITANSGSLFMSESRINSTSGLCISATTAITIRDCILVQNGTSPAIETSAGSTTIRQCFISSTSTSTTPSALIRFINGGNATAEIGFSKIEYTSSAVDTGGNKCCIQYAGAGFNTSSLYSCLLLCQGAITGSGGQIQCIQDPGAGGVNLSYGQLIAGATAHHIAPTITKTAYNIVP
jgi:hypothetical protein